jgi:predicted regulator of Ras-like GTPase activity (Roadblock/LC7/MglB family)
MPSVRFAAIVSILSLLAAAGCRGQAAVARDSSAAKATLASSSPRVFASMMGKSSLLYVTPAGGGAPHRLTSRTSGWESAAVISADGSVVAYDVAEGPTTKSEVWIAKLDGSNAHRVSGAEEDALVPALTSDNRTVFYLTSGAFGHASPIAASRRHQFDVRKVAIDASAATSNNPSEQLTHQELYDVSSLSVSPDGKRFLICTYRYPMGSVIEEYEVDSPLRIHASYQPHVSGEVSSGPQFGEAAYVHDGQDIVFTAASGGFEYDYNVYQISVMDDKHPLALTHDKGVINAFAVDPDGTIFISRDGHSYLLDPKTRALREEKL